MIASLRPQRSLRREQWPHRVHAQLELYDQRAFLVALGLAGCLKFHQRESRDRLFRQKDARYPSNAEHTAKRRRLLPLLVLKVATYHGFFEIEYIAVLLVKVSHSNSRFLILA